MHPESYIILLQSLTPRNERVVGWPKKGGDSSIFSRDDGVIHADWEWHGHVALWSCPFEEAGQYVAVKVNESEGGGLPWRTLSTT